MSVCIYIYIYIYIYGFIVTHRLFFFYKSSFYKLFFPLIYRASTWRYLSFYIYLFYKQALGHTGFSSCDTWAQYLWHMGSVLATHGLSTCDTWAQYLWPPGFSTCDTWAQYLWHMGSVLVTHGLSTCDPRALEHRLSSGGDKLSRSTACGIFLD